MNTLNCHVKLAFECGCKSGKRYEKLSWGTPQMVHNGRYLCWMENSQRTM